MLGRITQTAIVVYESAMRKRVAEAAKDSLRNGEKMHSSDALENMLELSIRNTFLEA